MNGLGAPGGRPLLSVVTPTLNAANRLAEALDSVRDAEVGTAVEHVVVDGGSTDRTVPVLRGRPDVRWISEPDRGLSDAMNKGVAMARGEWVGWLNGDDYYIPGALAKVCARLENEEADWLTGPCLIVDDAGNEIRSAVTAYKRRLLRRYSFRSLLLQNYVAAPATFVRRKVLIELGGFDERFRYSMDYDLWLRLGRRGDPAVLDEPLTAFRMAAGSLSMTGFERQFAEHAVNAREHGGGHPVAVGANAAMSRLIVLAYRGMRAMRRLRGGRYA